MTDDVRRRDDYQTIVEPFFYYIYCGLILKRHRDFSANISDGLRILPLFISRYRYRLIREVTQKGTLHCL